MTSQLKEFNCVSKKMISQSHRLLCDLNRDSKDGDCFRTKDFFGRRAFRPGKSFLQKEKKELLNKYWNPFHEKIEKELLALDKKNPKCLLLVDYHNTSGDHPLGEEKKYMPGFVLSNLDGQMDEKTGKPINGQLFPAKYLKNFKDRLEARLEISVEINKIYHGGFHMRWCTELAKKLNLKSRLYAFQIEYNLDFVVNPITREIDKKALGIMQTALNRVLGEVYEKLPG